MDAHTNDERDAVRPLVPMERSLTRRGCGHRVGGRAEDAEEGITLCIDHLPAGGIERLTQEAAMRRKDLPVAFAAELLEQLRRSLDIGEQKCDSAAERRRRRSLTQIPLRPLVAADLRAHLITRST